jgi:hypothetical protein
MAVDTMTKSWHTCEACRAKQHFDCQFSTCECEVCKVATLDELLMDELHSGGEKKKMIEKQESGTGKYLNVAFVNSNKVTEIRINSIAEEVEKEFENKKTGIMESKKLVEVMVVANDSEETEVLWTMNKTSRNIIVDTLSTDEKTWVGKVVPITVSGGGDGMNAAVYPDRIRFEQLHKTKGTLD